MELKQLVPIPLAFATGILVASFLLPGKPVPSKFDAPPSLEVGASNTGNVSIDRLRAEYERQIADLKSQLDSTGLKAQNVADLNPAALTLERRLAIFQELGRGGVEAIKKEETERLLAAGFTMDRIEWLRKRSEELAADWIQTDDRLRQQGKFDVNATLAHMFDRDIGLRQEIGDDEYARYRQALGRGIGLNVSEPIAGGIGARAGIKPGDQIIAYNGVRVFNMGDLSPYMAKNATAGTTVAVDVQRNGETIRLSAEGGDLRIRPEIPLLTGTEMESRVKERVKKFGQEIVKLHSK